MGPDIEYLQNVECADKLYFTLNVPSVGNLSFLANLHKNILLRDVY
jgi:hypothetical protein